ncbi:AAA family ATPase [Geodermatophilus sp. CPCC 206100]|uniref:AAA family ATPase n=1 Tax=Geodermatophilus sp. CPCC 206100 TaxID=3020054 RepID=UPI003B0035A7
MTLRGWCRELLRRWRWLAGGLAVGLAVAGLVTALTPARYAAGTTLYVSPGVPTTDAPSAYQGGLLSEHRMKSYVELATGERLADDVAAELGLSGGADLAGRITAVAQPETLVMTITATDRSPQRAADLADLAAASFGRLVEQLEQTPGEPGPSPVRVQVVEAAEPPTAPVSPDSLVNLVLGALLGLLAGLGLAALRRSLDDAVGSAHALQERTGVPVLGVVPLPAEPRPGRAAAAAPARLEALRRLRAALHHSTPGADRAVLVVTGPRPDEGRTTLVCDLADAIAAGGSRVLVVDTDLRRPTVAEYLGTEPRPGLVDLLAGGSRLAEAIRPGRPGSFDVLTGVPVPGNSTEVVGSQQLVDLLEELRQRYEVVLLDSPPLLEAADGSELAAVADGVLLVCRAGRTTYPQVEESLDALDAVSARVLGVVLTVDPTRARRPGARPGRRAAAHPEPDGTPLLAGSLRRARRPRPAGSGAGPDDRAGSPAPAPVRLTAPRAGEHASPGSANHHGPVPER